MGQTGDKILRVAVLGASGYSGIEALRLLALRPEIRLTALTSEHYVGRAVEEVHRHLSGLGLPRFEGLDADQLRGRADAVVSCLPSRVGAPTVARLVNAGVRVLDLSPDFRLRDPEAYRRVYGAEHPAPGLLAEAVYGLTEFQREEIRGARLVAVPGCYPTGALLGLLPLVRRRLIELEGICVDAKSGTSGARRAPELVQLFAEVNENLRPYSVGSHRHGPEIEQELARAAGGAAAVTFVPHLLPATRGILTSIFARPRPSANDEAIREAYRAELGGSPFVRLLAPGQWPELRNVRATNGCELSFFLDRRTGTLAVFTAIDNLGKGAAGQAVQNLNLMFGFDERAGLAQVAPVP